MKNAKSISNALMRKNAMHFYNPSCERFGVVLLFCILLFDIDLVFELCHLKAEILFQI